MLDTTQTVNWKEHIASVLESRFAAADAKHLVQYGERLMEQKAWSSDKEWLNQLILEGLAQLDEEEPQWTYIAASLYLELLYFQASQNRGYNFEDKYGSFYS